MKVAGSMSVKRMIERLMQSHFLCIFVTLDDVLDQEIVTIVT